MVYIIHVQIAKQSLILVWLLIYQRIEGAARNPSEEESKLSAKEYSKKGLEQ
jgi:hypothetical protein